MHVQRNVAAILILALVLAPQVAWSQDDESGTTQEYEAQTASVPAPAGSTRSLAMEPPSDPAAERERRDALLSDHLRPGPLGESSARSLAMPPPAPPLNTPVTSPSVAISTNNPLGNPATNSVTSTVLEPSLAVRGQEVLYTSNWFASFSTDGGASFSYVNPSTTFPAIPGQPFCCDQVAIYDPSNDMMIWFLQYVKDANQNTARVAVAVGADIANQQWSFYDFTPLGVGGWNNEWFDFPDLALSDNFLYVTTNAFTTTTNNFTRAVILRLSLAEMAANAALNFTFFNSTVDFSLRPTHGATDTMYFANHLTTDTIRVFAWPESGNALTSTDIMVQPWSNASRAGAGPDGPWLGRSDPRITAAWLRGGVAGFGWSAAQGFGFAHPQVRVALVDTASMALVGEPHLWNPNFAYAYPAASTNGNGEVGVSVFFGGGTHSPSHAVGTFDGTGNWQIQTTVNGTHSPDNNKWGDYLTVRPDPNDADAWFATGYSLQGGGNGSNIEPRFLRFETGVAAKTISVSNLNPVTLDVGDTTTIQATVTQGGTPVPGETVSFSASPAGIVTLSAASALTDAAGVATTMATAAADGDASVSGSIPGDSDSAIVKVPDLSTLGLLLVLGAILAIGLYSRRRRGEAGGR
ncbi:MAG: hypothetical protein GY769_02135 [bacterium]|nr:hypothetical protein [bacterium]